MIEQQHITRMNITKNSITIAHDEVVHLAWAKSPWSSFQWLDSLYYAQNCEYTSLQCSDNSETYSNGSRMPKNACLASFCS